MAVVERKRKKGSVFYAVNEWQGRQVSERVGSVKRDAQIRDRAMKKEIADGTYQPKEQRRSIIFKPFAEAWGKERMNASAEDERRLLRLYVFSRPAFADKRLDEWKPLDTAELVKQLRAEKKPDGITRRLSDKTIANLLGVLNLIFNAAILAELCNRNPIVLPPGTIKRRPATEKEIYTPGEAAVLTRHHAIPWPTRILNGLCLLAGLREGEACGRRWRDLSESVGPLAALTVFTQYGDQPLKTERPRMVPVHPALAALLLEWREEGFELYTGRKPTPDDFIVPNEGPRSKHPHHTRSSYYKSFVRFAEAAGVRPRSLHATRHTFISLCRRGGARKDVLERVTHNARGDIVDRYTHFDWLPLCEAVSCLNLDVRPNVLPPGGNGGESGGPQLDATTENPQQAGQNADVLRGSIPGASTTPTAYTGSAEKRRQEKRQESERYRAELSASNRKRRRRLLSLKEADPDAAHPGLAVCKALDAAYRVGAGAPDAPAEMEAALLEGLEAIETAGGSR